MRILVRNATILPMDTREHVMRGSIAIEGRKIVAVGEVPPGFVADKVIDAEQCIALPGLVNAHTHASMVYFRNYRDSVSDLHDWLQEIWRLEDTLVPSDIRSASKLAIAEMILGGTTCFSDMYFFQEETVSAIMESGIKANVGLTLFGDEEDSARRIERSLGFLRQARDRSDRMLRYDIAPHAVYTCTPGTYRLAAAVAREEGCKVHTHASETAREVTECKAQYGRTPVSHLDSLGILEGGAYLAHVVHPDESDIALLARRQVTVIHNPSSNCKLGSGIAPLHAYQEANVPLALGTDGASSNNALDMFQELRLAAMLASVSTGNPTALSPYDLLHMATAGGARALGRETECGSIETGKDADIILIDTSGAHMSPLNNPFSALVYSAKSSDIKTVICAGRMLMEDRVLKTIDLKAVTEEVLDLWRNIQGREG